MAPKAQYRYIGTYAEQLASGRPVAPGDFFDLTDEEIREHDNERLIHDGLIIGSNKEGEHQVGLAKSRMTRRLSGLEEEATTDESKED